MCEYMQNCPIKIIYKFRTCLFDALIFRRLRQGLIDQSLAQSPANVARIERSENTGISRTNTASRRHFRQLRARHAPCPLQCFCLHSFVNSRTATQGGESLLGKEFRTKCETLILIRQPYESTLKGRYYRILDVELFR
jgi:hypothetical protein